MQCQVCGKRITHREREIEKRQGERVVAGVREQAAKFGSKMFAGFALLWF